MFASVSSLMMIQNSKFKMQNCIVPSFCILHFAFCIHNIGSRCGMQNAECRMQKGIGVHSSFCLLPSAFCIRRPFTTNAMTTPTTLTHANQSRSEERRVGKEC